MEDTAGGVGSSIYAHILAQTSGLPPSRNPSHLTTMSSSDISAAWTPHGSAHLLKSS